MSRLPDFKAEAARAQMALGEEGAHLLLEAGRAWDLAPTLASGGAVIFPHVKLDVCGHMVAAAVHACLECGTARVVALGVLHALTEELEEARVRVADGSDVTKEAAWGIQGPGLPGRQDWLAEFSMDNFLYLWRIAAEKRGGAVPELVVRYPYLAGGKPGILPGIGDLAEITRGAAVVATADPFHHGIGYGAPPGEAAWPDERGLNLAQQSIREGLKLLHTGDFWGYNRHCVDAKSDARDTGQVLRYLLGPVEGRILDIVADDTSAAYGAPPPTWVAGALIEFVPPTG